MAQPPISKPTTQSRENEDGSFRPAPRVVPAGVTRVLAETFTVGPYSYTNLADAVAQARRMDKSGAGL